MGAYTRVYYHGKRMNSRTKSMLQQAERYLGYQMDVWQGSYNSGVSASAGTHDGGGALDLAPYDRVDKVKALRQVGFAAWYRPYLHNVWPSHIHCIAVGDREVSSGAASQIRDYYAHLNGLAGHAYDSTWRPTVIVPFHYPLQTVDLSNLQQQARRPDHQYHPSVKRYQKALNIKTGAGLTVDGYFGAATLSASKRYERSHGGDGDGVPGRLTHRLGLALFKVKQ